MLKTLPVFFIFAFFLVIPPGFTQDAERPISEQEIRTLESGRVDTRLDRLEHRLDSLEQNLRSMDDEMRDLERSLDDLKRRR